MELWQLDVTASAFLTNGTEVKIVTGVDDHSRFCVLAKAVMRATARPVCLAFVEAMRARVLAPCQIPVPSVLSHLGSTRDVPASRERPRNTQVLIGGERDRPRPALSLLGLLGSLWPDDARRPFWHVMEIRTRAAG